jgi:hypothetical protein
MIIGSGIPARCAPRTSQKSLANPSLAIFLIKTVVILSEVKNLDIGGQRSFTSFKMTILSTILLVLRSRVACNLTPSVLGEAVGISVQTGEN